MCRTELSLLLCILALGTTAAMAQEDGGGTSKTGWFNKTDLSLVVTQGNSNTTTLGLGNVLTRAWERSKIVLKLDGTRSNTADEAFLLIEPGITFQPGETPDSPNTITVNPPKKPDVVNYFAEGRYTRKLGGTRTWNAGASWDRNKDAGILNRFIVFGGVGNVWRDGEKLHIDTGYGVSYSDREEETPDPEKEAQFVGARVTFDVGYQIVKSTRLQYDLTGNLNLQNTKDYSLDSKGGLSVKISKRLALAVTLQSLFNSEPALEDRDIVARVELIDPDEIPGSGDEFFRTLESGGIEITLGEGRTRRDSLDMIFRTSLVIEF